MTQAEKLWAKFKSNATFYTVWQNNGDNAAPTPLVYRPEDVEQEDYVGADDPEAAISIFDSEESARNHARVINGNTGIKKITMVTGTIQEMLSLSEKMVRRFRETHGKHLRIDLVSIDGNSIYREVLMSTLATRH